MKLLVAAASCAALVFGSAAGAQTPMAGAYVQLNLASGLTGALRASGHDVVLGPVSVRETSKAGGMVTALFGRRLGAGPLSLEGEGLYLNNAIGSPDLNAALGVSAGLRAQTWGGAANLKLEGPAFESAGFKPWPYLAMGVGYGHQDMTILGDHYTGDGLLWQAKAGLALHTGGRFTWDVGYRYLSEPTFDTNKLGLTARIRTDVQAVSVGLRYALH